MSAAWAERVASGLRSALPSALGSSRKTGIRADDSRRATRLLVQPEDGVTPLVTAIESAKRTIDLCVFRLSHRWVIGALRSAVERGVRVRALIAHRSGRGAKLLERLSDKLESLGAAVTHTDDFLRRHHGKMMIVDDTRLFVLGYNFTARDIDKSRSLGIVTRVPALLKEARTLFDADLSREPYTPGHPGFVVSPLNSRGALLALIESASHRLLIYDMRLCDRLMQEALERRAAAGVLVHVLGQVDRKLSKVEVRLPEELRLHIRAIVADDQRVFIGSQSLRRIELEKRREIGLIVEDQRLVSNVRSVFRQDWRLARRVPVS